MLVYFFLLPDAIGIAVMRSLAAPYGMRVSFSAGAAGIFDSGSLAATFLKPSSKPQSIYVSVAFRVAEVVSAENGTRAAFPSFASRSRSAKA